MSLARELVNYMNKNSVRPCSWLRDHREGLHATDREISLLKGAYFAANGATIILSDDSIAHRLNPFSKKSWFCVD